MTAQSAKESLPIKNGSITPAAPREKVDDRVFGTFASFLKKTSGFALSSEKSYLIDTRLGPLVTRLKISSLQVLADIIAAGNSPDIERAVIEAMTTNETLFFRDQKPFQALQTDIIPAIMQRRADNRMRFLCAAASTGQEPYSVAMAIQESKAALGSWAIDIVATDIDASVLKKAEAGIYSQFEVQRGVPTPYLIKYFNTHDSKNWCLKDSIRKAVRFQQLNLLHDISSLGVFDVIFCRNVLLYFDVATKTDVLKRLTRQLTPGGYLFLGCAETIIGLCDGLMALPSARGLYQRT